MDGPALLEAKAGAGVVEAPQKRLKHVKVFGRQLAVMLALLGAPRERAGIGHNPRLGVPLHRARASVAKDFFAAGLQILRQAAGNRHDSSVLVVDNPPKGGRFQAKRIRRQKGLASDRIFGEYRTCN
jgi:hypothetical protein